MTRRSLMCITALLLATLQTIGAQQTTAHGEKLLARAHHKATVDGDMQGAIVEYKTIVAGAGSDRALAAQALVRMAECYQKLGDAEAKSIYERVVRDYGDQQESATVARMRLGRSAQVVQSTDIAASKVMTLPSTGDFSGSISPDGRLLSHVDWATGDLAVYDLSARRSRLLTNKGPWTQSEQHALASAISRDGKRVAYSWKSDEGRWQLRIAALEGPSLPRSRVVFDNQELSVVGVSDWSPDAKSIAVQLDRRDGTSVLGLISMPFGNSLM